MGKWQPVDEANLVDGEIVKAKNDDVTLIGEYTKQSRGSLRRVGGVSLFSDYKWFRRKPAKPTRPVEPPAGTVVRNVRTGEQAVRYADFEGRWFVHKDDRFVGNKHWNDFVAPGDEIEVAEWVKP